MLTPLALSGGEQLRSLDPRVAAGPEQLTSQADTVGDGSMTYE
jgi:hypothetical protein